VEAKEVLVERGDAPENESGRIGAEKFLTFKLAGQEYGLEIHKVREIIGLHDITFVPQTPEYVKGVINLRGKVIPVIDLRLRFGFPPESYHERTCIIVVETDTHDDQREVNGLVVDAVSEVLNIDSGQIEATPPMGSEIKTDYILGLAKGQGTVRILLDIDRILKEN